MPTPPPNDDTGVGPAPPETVGLWVKLVGTMGPAAQVGDPQTAADAGGTGPPVGELAPAIDQSVIEPVEEHAATIAAAVT